MARAIGRAVEADEILRALQGYGLTQADIAAAVGVTDRAVRDWLQTKPLRHQNEKRLHDLRQVVLLLDDSLSRRGVGQWFRARNRSLDGRRPLDVLAEGDFEAVHRAATAFADGAYV